MFIQEFDSQVKRNCSFCGVRRADAIWMSFDGELFCCHECALGILPQFAADALVGAMDAMQLESLSGDNTAMTKERELLSRFIAAFEVAVQRRQSP